jgi:hypothetical protein
MYRAPLVTDLLRCGYKVRFRVMGTSMLPTIPPGSLVIVEPIDAHLLEKGDIVLTNGAGRFIAHRIEHVHADRRGVRKFVLRGDNLPQCDLPVTAAAILGRVRCVAANDNWLGTVGVVWSALVDRFGREARRALGGAA